MARVSVPIEKINVERFLEALFPCNVHEGLVNVKTLMAVCLERAAETLEKASPCAPESDDHVSAHEIKSEIESAMSYIRAASVLVEFMPHGSSHKFAMEYLETAGDES